MNKILIPTVTVAISAFNEENNIVPFLKSVLKQKEDGFILKDIKIYNDGSTDNTIQEIKKIKNNKIFIFSDSRRIGKSSRLNQIYQSLNSDYLFQSDADVILSTPFVIRDMIKPLMKDSNVAMTGGNPTPVKGKTFTEKAVNCTFNAYAPLRQKLRDGNNIFSVDGRILAYKKDFIKHIHVPSNTIANDAYTYFCCLRKNYKYIHVPTAIVYFRSPQTLKDQIKQNTRFTAAPLRMGRLFSKKVVNYEYYIPKYILFWYMLKQFLSHPILSAYIFLVNIYCKLKAKKSEKKLTAVWSMANTTKMKIKKYE